MVHSPALEHAYGAAHCVFRALEIDVFSGSGLEMHSGSREISAVEMHEQIDESCSFINLRTT